MNAEIIAVGSELTTGDIVDTNSGYISRKLTELGINVTNQTVVPDVSKSIVSVLSSAVSRSQLIIFTGGLGPTPDDMTKETICNAVGMPLVENAESLKRIDDYFKRKGVPMAEANRKQALFPEGAKIFINQLGTADGCAIESGNQSIVMLPGPPSEMEHMFENSVVPYITKFLDGVVVSKTLRVFGVGESTVADKLGDILKSRDPIVATYVGQGDMRIKITSRGDTKRACIEKCEPVVHVIRKELGNAIYSENNKPLANVVVDELKKAGKKIATAESCTGGLISKMLTDVSGASSVFEYGISAYANRVKTDILGVGEDILENEGAVSSKVSEAMAIGVKCAGKSDLGIATTGYAEGGDGVPPHKVGLVYISLFDGEKVFTRRILAGHGSSDRERVRLAAAMNALDMVRLYLSCDVHFLSGGKVVPKEKSIIVEQKTFSAVAPIVEKEEIPEEPVVETPKEVIEEEPVRVDAVVVPLDEPKKEAEVTTDFLTEAEQKTAIEQQNAKEALENLEISREADKEIELVSNESEGVDLSALGKKDEKEEPEAKKEEEKKDGKSKKEKKTFKDFLKSIFPWKGDTKKNMIRKIAMLLCVTIFLGSAGYIVGYYYSGYKNSKLNNDLKNSFHSGDNVQGKDGIAGRFMALYEQNPDIVGWIKINNTKTDNPVVKGKNDSHDYSEYIYKTFTGEKSKYGTLFVKYTNRFDNQLSKNTVIYGHHMKDGQMFGDLKQYRGLDFYKKNPVIEFTPIFSQDIWRWQVFAVMLIDSRLPNTHSEYFDFSKTNFETDAEFAGFINEAYQRSIIDVGTPVELDDQIITLDTCAYDFNDARLIVMAKLVTGDEKFDAASAKYNSDVVYPKAYYKKGETPNKVNSDPVLVEGSVVSVPESSVPAESSDVSSSETSSETTEDNDDDDYDWDDWDDDDGDTETTTSQAASTPVTSTPAVSETTSEAPPVEQPAESVVTPDPEPTSSEDAPEEDASQGQPDG